MPISKFVVLRVIPSASAVMRRFFRIGRVVVFPVMWLTALRAVVKFSWVQVNFIYREKEKKRVEVGEKWIAF
jgi:hypothetical protein